eukprot:scaffold16743_cov129-Isochrysis_galbana.AAC.5
MQRHKYLLHQLCGRIVTRNGRRRLGARVRGKTITSGQKNARPFTFAQPVSGVLPGQPPVEPRQAPGARECAPAHKERDVPPRRGEPSGRWMGGTPHRIPWHARRQQVEEKPRCVQARLETARTASPPMSGRRRLSRSSSGSSVQPGSMHRARSDGPLARLASAAAASTKIHATASTRSASPSPAGPTARSAATSRSCTDSAARAADSRASAAPAPKTAGLFSSLCGCRAGRLWDGTSQRVHSQGGDAASHQPALHLGVASMRGEVRQSAALARQGQARVHRRPPPSVLPGSGGSHVAPLRTLDLARRPWSAAGGAAAPPPPTRG